MAAHRHVRVCTRAFGPQSLSSTSAVSYHVRQGLLLCAGDTASRPQQFLILTPCGYLLLCLSRCVPQGLLETLHALRNLLLRGLVAIAGLEVGAHRQRRYTVSLHVMA